MAGGGGDFPVGLEGDGSEVEDAAAFFVREEVGNGGDEDVAQGGFFSG